jgi:hypothetical protein
MEELKILQKVYDMVQYGYVCLRRFPKSERHTMAAEIKNHMLQVLRLILQANRRRDKRAILAESDVELDLLRLYIRLAHDVIDPAAFPLRSYERWSKMLNEIGKMLGGWMKSQYKN